MFEKPNYKRITLVALTLIEEKSPFLPMSLSLVSNISHFLPHSLKHLWYLNILDICVYLYLSMFNPSKNINLLAILRRGGAGRSEGEPLLYRAHS